MKIATIKSRQVLDSRGNPTVEATISLDNNIKASAIVPSGASTGKHEAVELRDNNPHFYLGRSVLQAVANINDIIAPALIGQDCSNQSSIDNILLALDGTTNKSKLGANAILAVSTANAKVAARANNLSLFRYLGGPQAVHLPMPMMNILNGGAHADNTVDFQEFMVVPKKADSFSDALHKGVSIFHHLKNVLKKNGYSTNVGDEGGFAPSIGSNEEAIEIVLQAIESAGYLPGEDAFIAMDAACSELYDEESKMYCFKKSSKKMITSEEMVAYWESWVNKYPIISIEDGMAEDDWTGWKLLTDRIGSRCQLVGDDLFVTNVNRLQHGIDTHTANSILVKINQIGTISETIKTVELAHRNKYTTIMSHRSGETEDTTIADLSVALHCGQIKTGSASRTDRIAKYNQLIRIEEELGKNAKYGIQC